MICYSDYANERFIDITYKLTTKSGFNTPSDNKHEYKAHCSAFVSRETQKSTHFVDEKSIILRYH